MQRRNFLDRITFGLSATPFGISGCKKINDHTVSGDLPELQIPAYKSGIQTNFTNATGWSANDKVLLALIGAGSWGTTVIMNAVGLKT